MVARRLFVDMDGGWWMAWSAEMDREMIVSISSTPLSETKPLQRDGTYRSKASAFACHEREYTSLMERKLDELIWMIDSSNGGRLLIDDYLLSSV